MQSTYITTTSAGTTPAQAISGDATRAIVVRKILVGLPVSAATLTVFNIGNALSNNTTQIAFGMTMPTFAASAVNPGMYTIDFRASSGAGGGSVEEDGLICQTGGSLAISSNMQITVLWDYAEGN